jgi:hypothetical protein
MFPTTFKQTLATAVAGAAMAGAVGAQNAPAMPSDPVHDAYATEPVTAAPQLVEATDPGVGFDLSSAAIGAIGTGMIVIALTAGGLAWRRQTPGPHGSAHA